MPRNSGERMVGILPHDPEVWSEAETRRIELQCWDRFMEKCFQLMKQRGITQASRKEHFYGFKATEIERVHYYKHGHGHGVYFRLSDVLVIDNTGFIFENDDAERALYLDDIEKLTTSTN